MAVYVVHPRLTIGNDSPALRFHQTLISELEDHITPTSIANEAGLNTAQVTKDDILVVFNRQDQLYSAALVALLGDAVGVQATVIPVAINNDFRHPAKVIEKRQSYDVLEKVRARKLSGDGIATVAIALARQIIGMEQPTLVAENTQFFLSHRRLDGENITAAFQRQLDVLRERSFRDLMDIRVGDDAQEIIEANLRLSDIVIFLDTPKAGESEWIRRELSIAHSLNIPILWIRIGGDVGRVALPLKPLNEPHLVLDTLNAATDDIDISTVEKVVHMAFKLARGSLNKVFDQLRRIKLLRHQERIDLVEVDRKHMVFALRVPRETFRYGQKPLTHLIQVYGRWPRENDETRFHTLATDKGYVKHPEFGSPYDAAVMLGPIPEQKFEADFEGTYKDSIEVYADFLEARLNSSKAPQLRRGIIVSGAFPDCEPQHQQKLIDCLYAVCHSIFVAGGIVIFGAHPTFQHLIFDIAKRLRPDEYQSAVRMYVSRHFVADGALADFRKHATVFDTPDTPGDRNRSLTVMRQQMIADDQALGLIVLGGKTTAGGHTPGVDEEIQLASASGLPVFIFGSVGGRSADRAQHYCMQGWAGLGNDLTDTENIELMQGLDYRSLADMVVRALGM